MKKKYLIGIIVILVILAIWGVYKMSGPVSVVSPEQQSGQVSSSISSTRTGWYPGYFLRRALLSRPSRTQPNLRSTLSRPTPCAPNSNCRITLDNYYKAIPAEVTKLVSAPVVKVASPTSPQVCNNPKTDLSGDGVVNSIDIQMVINSTLNIGNRVNSCADINGDGFITAYDVYSVINYTLGIRS